MNVIISNERQNELTNLDIDIIKSMTGEFSVDEIITTFKNFYFNKMILDITALKDYLNIANIQKLAMNLDAGKIIFFLPNIPEVSNNVYLAKLVAIGIYNFTNNVDGVVYLLTHENTHDDVSYVEDDMNKENDSTNNFDKDSFGISNISSLKVLGVKSVTDHAGSTTLIYMMKKELEKFYGDTIYAVEVNRHDFEYFNIKNTISTNKNNLGASIDKIDDASIILVDLNDSDGEGVCSDILYLVEPTSIMLNKLMRTNKNIFKELEDKKIVLNDSLLSENDIKQFEYEANTKVFFNIPPTDERRKSEYINKLLTKLNLINNGGKKSGGLFGFLKF